MDKKYSNNKGLSLVEVVMSALLLSLVLVALFATYRNANDLVSRSRCKLIALTWAQSEIENRNMGLGVGAYTNPAAPNWLSVEKSGQLNPAPVVTNLGATMDGINVTVEWTE